MQVMGMELNKSAKINVSADRLWSILADDFDKIGEWARGVDSSGPSTDAAIPDGASVGGRVCQAPGFGAINETFTSYDAAARSYAFEATATKIPSFVRNVTNHTVVKSLGPETSEVQLTITADNAGIRGALVKPVLTRKFGAALDATLEDLKIFAESGKISSEKSKALAKSGH
jgi:Polyketide cyclase / dehydrase and lipid transport